MARLALKRTYPLGSVDDAFAHWAQVLKELESAGISLAMPRESDMPVLPEDTKLYSMDWDEIAALFQDYNGYTEYILRRLGEMRSLKGTLSKAEKEAEETLFLKLRPKHKNNDSARADVHTSVIMKAFRSALTAVEAEIAVLDKHGEAAKRASDFISRIITMRQGEDLG